MTSSRLKNDDPNLKDFDRIGAQSYLLIPRSADKLGLEDSAKQRRKGGDIPPDLTILCTWLGAPSRPIAKYVDGHISLYPQTPILLLRSVFEDFTFRGTSSRVERAKASAETVKTYVDKAKTEGRGARILLHAFSNGGSWSACMLQQAYSKSTGGNLPLSAIVIDSAPSLPRVRVGHSAMMQAVPKIFLLRLVVSLLTWLIIGLYWILERLRLAQSVVRMLRKALNDPDGPFLKRQIPRTYLCSKEDEMIPMEDVVLHADEARIVLEKQGVQKKQQLISIEEFKGSKHVGHMMIDATRYWNIVRKTWQTVP